MRRWALVALLVGACAPKAEPVARATVDFNCADGYAMLSQQISALPGLKAQPKEPSEPYRFFTEADGRTSYVFTLEGAPGHPAILRQRSVQENGAKVMKNDGCPYGDRDGFDEVMAYLESLNLKSERAAP